MSAKATKRSSSILLCIATIAAVAVIIRVDPFRLSVIANAPNFQAQYVQEQSRPQVFSRDRNSKLRMAQKRFLNELSGPESLAFDPRGRGPYTGIADGRIMRWDGPENGWSDFATTSPNRSEFCNPSKPPSKVIETEHICGRPLGLRFDSNTGELYIADAYFGILKVSPKGGQATPLATEAEGIPLMFANDLDISAADGTIYFTDSSSKYQRRNFFLLVLSGDDSGRVLKYDPVTKDTKVLVRGLQFPNGVTLSKDESFLVIAETVPGRLLRHWLKGPKAGTTETMAILPGHPDNVRRNDKGEFWVALHCRRNLSSRLSGAFPSLRRWVLSLPIPFKQVYRMFNGHPHGMVVRYDESGQLLEVLEDEEGKVVKFASEAAERDGQLWIGSVLLPYVAVFDLGAK